MSKEEETEESFLNYLITLLDTCLFVLIFYSGSHWVLALRADRACLKAWTETLPAQTTENKSPESHFCNANKKKKAVSKITGTT